MRLKTIVKLGTMVSVLLFVLAVGYYAFMRLDMKEHNRHVDLFSLVPSHCEGVLESDDINRFFSEYAALNYSQELEHFRHSGLFNFLVSELNDYTYENDHGLNSQMGRLAVSFHQMGTARHQVVYFHLGMADEQMLSDILQEYMPGNFLPKEEVYRGYKMLIYPLSYDEFLTTFTEDGFIVLSYQKRLVEEVIDAWLDKTSLRQDETFSRILEKRKSPGFLTFYGKEASLPFLDLEADCWTEYDFHMNSDVVYLTGNTYVQSDSSRIEGLSQYLEQIPTVKEEGVIISAHKDSTALYMNQAFEANDDGYRTLFNECVANLANEVDFSLVVDMQKVEENPKRFQAYLPSFILDHSSFLQSFVLSVQMSKNSERLSHIWVFTYKH